MFLPFFVSHPRGRGSSLSGVTQPREQMSINYDFDVAERLSVHLHLDFRERIFLLRMSHEITNNAICRGSLTV